MQDARCQMQDARCSNAVVGRKISLHSKCGPIYEQTNIRKYQICALPIAHCLLYFDSPFRGRISVVTNKIRGWLLILKIPSLPRLDKFSPGKWIENVLWWCLALVVIASGLVAQCIVCGFSSVYRNGSR